MKAPSKLPILLGILVLAIGVALWKMLPSPSLPVITGNVPHQASTAQIIVPPVKTIQANDTSTTIQTMGVAAQRKFSEMSLVERKVIFDQIETQDLPDIMQAWLDADRVEHDDQKHQALATILTNAMKQRPTNPEFLLQMRNFVSDNANSSLDRQMLLVVLSNVQSKETVILLLDLAHTLPDPSMRDAALGNISNIGGVGNKEYLTETLEQAWIATDNNDAKQLRSLACAMAGVGAASSMELLLTAALSPNGKEVARKQAALYALSTGNLLNEHAVPALAARLSKDFPTNAASKLASDTLAEMHGVAAANALLVWFESANAAVAPLAHAFVLQTSNPAMLQASESALNPSASFRSEQNREAIRTALAEHKAGIIFQPVPKPGSGQ